MLHIGHVRLFHSGGLYGGTMFGVCLPTVPLWSVFLAATFPSRGHSSRVLTRGSHQQRAAKGETLWQEEGLEQIDLWPSPKCHFIASWHKEPKPAHTHACTHEKKHLTYTAKPHGYPHILNLDHITLHKHRISPYLTLKHEAVLRSVYQKVPNLCWHKPSIWGYQQMQTLVQSGKGIFAPVQRTRRCWQFQRWKD